MRISAVEEYGLRCLLQLAKKGTKDQLSISEIAEMEGLSIPYASKLLAILRRAGLVTAERGRGGGFTIAREPGEISLYEALTALGGPMLDPNHCGRYTGLLDQCVHVGSCGVHDVLGGLAGYVQDFLSGTTLADMISTDKLQLFKRAGEHIALTRSALEEELKKVSPGTPLE